MLSTSCRTFASLLILFSYAGGVHAGDPPMACPGNAGESLPPPAETAALAEQLAGLAESCGRDAGFLAYRGAVLIQLGQMEAAAALLERALMIAPELAGAQADYARALAALGDTRGAQSLIDNLLARHDVPDGLRAALQDWQRHAGRDQGSAAWQTGGSLTLRGGHESNLNSAPGRSTLDLTLPDGLYTLPLDSSNRAQGGGAMLAEANIQAGRNLADGGRLQLLADIRGRHAPAMNETDFQQYEGLAVLTLPVGGANGAAPKVANQLSLGASRLDYGGEHIYSAQRIGLARIYQVGACLSGGSLDLELRRFPTSGNLDGRFAGVGGNLRCPVGEARLSMIARVGEDKADSANRPGGDQQRLDWRLAYARPWAGGQLDAEVNFGHQSDLAAYSELLENGAKRHLNRLGFRLEWARPIAKGVEGIVTLESFRQGSNIPLFQISSTAVWLGGRWSWGN